MGSINLPEADAANRFVLAYGYLIEFRDMGSSCAWSTPKCRQVYPGEQEGEAYL
jgi:hypothetical protein